ncbi:MAG: hypothetical protein SGJ11_10685 [Phycisphaerae bacterium]|mgnify:CR=1 FL=1|nr:hypothetical protein [Phycisphaerae bacterium]
MLATVVGLAVLLLGQTPAGLVPQQSGDGAAQPRFEDLPWPVRLGLRAAKVEVSLPVAKQVTLVPDTATWLDEVSRWTREARWPVLIEDDRLAPMFIRAFQPERVVRRTSSGVMPTSKADREQAMDAAVRQAWGGDPAQDSLSALKAARLSPAGVVITSAEDTAWTAAVALAAGRGLPLLFVDGDFGTIDSTLDAARFSALNDAIRAAIESTGLAYTSLGDAVDAVALCRTVAAKCNPALSPAERMPLTPDAKVKHGEPLATTDCLGREAGGARSTVVGWIPGASDRAAYMAMCSLFLPRTTWWFVSGYDASEPWSHYAPDNAAAAARTAGFTTRVWTGDQATISTWRKMLMGGFDADVLVMNSHGNPDAFHLKGNDIGRPNDVPMLNRPLALHLVHSWSLVRPSDRDTVGGRFLERGVYAYFGSVQEPLLFAFVPPTALATRATAYAPFLVSSRMLDGPFDLPWRLTAIGDPLLVFIPPAKRTIPTAALPELRGSDVRAAATDRMKAIAAGGDTPQRDDLREATRDLVLLGNDEIAIGVWELARSKKLGDACASEVLPALFRARRFEDFLTAYRSVAKPSSDATEMLWHLAGPRGAQLDRATLELLRGRLRGPDVSSDLAMILPGIDRTMGRSASDGIVQSEMDRMKNEGLRSRLRALLTR